MYIHIDMYMYEHTYIYIYIFMHIHLYIFIRILMDRQIYMYSYEVVFIHTYHTLSLDMWGDSLKLPHANRVAQSYCHAAFWHCITSFQIEEGWVITYGVATRDWYAVRGLSFNEWVISRTYMLIHGERLPSTASLHNWNASCEMWSCIDCTCRPARA